MELAGATLLILLAGVTTKIVDLIKSRFFGDITLPGKMDRWLWPLMSMGVATAFALGIEGIGGLSMVGIEGAAVWLDKFVAVLVMGLGASIIWDFMDTDSRPDTN